MSQLRQPRPWRRLARWLAILLLLGISASGVNDGVHNLSAETTLGQKACIAAQFGYAVASVLAVAALTGDRSWAREVLWIWAGLLSLTAGLAAVVWGGAGVIVGLLAAASTAVIAAIIVWLAFQGWRGGETERQRVET